MNENPEISAKSQHNFHFLPHFYSKTTGLSFTIFSHDVEQLVEVLMQGDGAFRFRKPCRAKSEDS